MSVKLAARRIRLCADDYGIAPGVNRAIRQLIAADRLNATSVMTVGHAIGRDEADALVSVAANATNCAIGLHVTLTAPFRPLTSTGFRPLDGGTFLPLSAMLRRAAARRLDAQMIETEIGAQIAAFVGLFGRPPDYFDGHQHVHLFPQVRDGFLAAVRRRAPQAWVRQCGRARPLAKRLTQPKALLLDVLSVGFRERARRAGIAFNSAFAGAYDFTAQLDFATQMSGFLDGLPDGGLVMCHPGFIDEMLVALDPLTDQRQREYDYLASDAFPALLAARNVTFA